jgi:Zn-dependent protease
MDESVRLGRVAGIPIGANWSLLLIFGLIVLSLGGAQLPHSAPGHSSAAYYLLAVGVAAVFYACLLAHELAHAVVARRHGIGVNGIVLWLLGGVSKLEGEPSEARTELEVAAAGPAMSLGLALVFFALSRVTGIGHPASLAAAGLGWLGWVNGALAVFNLIPAFPLDGGRVLRALAWGHRGDKKYATELAARMGRAFGYGFIGLGIVGAFATSFGLSGVWLALIGWFLVTASRQEAYSSVRAHELTGLRVGDAMIAAPVTVPAWVTLDQVWEECVWKRRLSAFPVVVADGTFVGVASASAIQAVPTAEWPTVTVGAIVEPSGKCVVAGPDDDLAPVARRLSLSPHHIAVVLWGGRVTGVVTPIDVDRAARRGTARPPRQPVAA